MCSSTTPIYPSNLPPSGLHRNSSRIVRCRRRCMARALLQQTGLPLLEDLPLPVLDALEIVAECGGDGRKDGVSDGGAPLKQRAHLDSQLPHPHPHASIALVAGNGGRGGDGGEGGGVPKAAHPRIAISCVSFAYCFSSRGFRRGVSCGWWWRWWWRLEEVAVKVTRRCSFPG